MKYILELEGFDGFPQGIHKEEDCDGETALDLAKGWIHFWRIEYYENKMEVRRICGSTRKVHNDLK